MKHAGSCQDMLTNTSFRYENERDPVAVSIDENRKLHSCPGGLGGVFGTAIPEKKDIRKYKLIYRLLRKQYQKAKKFLEVVG